jgi:hypothetical protein
VETSAAAPLTRTSYSSGRRESNSRSQLGKLIGPASAPAPSSKCADQGLSRVTAMHPWNPSWATHCGPFVARSRVASPERRTFRPGACGGHESPASRRLSASRARPDGRTSGATDPPAARLPASLVAALLTTPQVPRYLSRPVPVETGTGRHSGVEVFVEDLVDRLPRATRSHHAVWKGRRGMTTRETLAVDHPGVSDKVLKIRPIWGDNEDEGRGRRATPGDTQHRASGRKSLR